LGKGVEWDTTRFDIMPSFVYNIYKSFGRLCEENIKMNQFADDAKMYCHIKNVADKDKLQRGIDNFVDLTSKWQVSLNINKCKIFLRKVTGPKFAHVQTISWGYDESV